MFQVYADVGVENHLLRVWRTDGVRCLASWISLEDFVTVAFGPAAVTCGTARARLAMQRRLLLALERDRRASNSVAKDSSRRTGNAKSGEDEPVYVRAEQGAEMVERRAWMATSAGWESACARLRGEIAIRDMRIAALEGAAALTQTERFRRAATACTACGQVFGRISPLQVRCPVCVYSAAARLSTRPDAQCQRCAAFCPIPSFLRDPATGHTICPSCAHRCPTPHCPGLARGRASTLCNACLAPK